MKTPPAPVNAPSRVARTRAKRAYSSGDLIAELEWRVPQFRNVVDACLQADVCPGGRKLGRLEHRVDRNDKKTIGDDKFDHVRQRLGCAS